MYGSLKSPLVIFDSLRGLSHFTHLCIYMALDAKSEATLDLNDLPNSPIEEDAVPKIDPHLAEVIEAEVDAHVGVKKVEAAEKVYGRYSKWFLFTGYA